jgi:hypothetical protein
LAIVVPRRSWFEISLWKTGKAGRQKKEQRKKRREGRKKEKKKDDIQTAELDRRDQVTATKSWSPVPFEKREQRSIIR